MPKPAPTDTTNYVVYYCERLRDGVQEGARVVTGLEAALALATKLKNGFAGDNVDVQIFKLGKEVKLKTSDEITEVKTQKKTTKVEVAP